MSPSLILLRGLPGSGKSTLAKVLAGEQWPVFSVDDYFTDAKTKEYKFNFAENHLAYKQCEQNTVLAMMDKKEKIFIDNTFTLEWELEPYFKMAAKHNYKVFVLTVENRHGSKSIHDIPEENIRKMAEKYRVVLF